MEIKVDVISRETIKPSSPTPHHLRSYKLSLLDQFMPALYTPLVLYYAAASGGSRFPERSHQVLKKSLSETLTRYYPLAGRIKDHLSVDCNDDGVDYIEARVNCSISCILEQPKSELQNHFVPIEFKESGGSGPLLLIQASFFECGGMALSMYTNHKLADAASFTTFLKAWAATASGFPDAVAPDFTAASIFPARDDFLTPPSHVYEKPTQKGAARRFVFSASKLNALKAKAASGRVQQPTRVEVVMALLWKCSVAASRSRLGLKSTNPRRPSVLVVSANMRARFVPALPESSFGNIGLPLVVQADESENEMDLPSLVCSIRESKLELSKNCSVLEICSSLMELRKLQMRGGEMDMYTHTSWARMPMYEADFGWGKPTWATIGHSEVPNIVVLSPTRDGEGIEVWVTLIEQDMAFFECNQDLLAFATLNPSALSKSHSIGSNQSSD